MPRSSRIPPQSVSESLRQDRPLEPAENRSVFARGTALAALLAALLALLAYGATALAFARPATPHHAYFHELAASFLAGRLNLDEPSSTHDLTQHGGRWYVPFPPLPAVLLLPWIAALGPDRLSTVAFNIVLSGAAVGCVWWLLAALAKAGVSRLGVADGVWLTLLFALSTSNWYLSVQGTVWALGQSAAVLCHAAAAALAVSCRSPLPAAIVYAASLWARPNTVFFAFLLAGLAMEPGADASRSASSRRRTLLVGAIPAILSVLGLLWYNHARFGDPLDFGYTRQNVSIELIGALHEQGLFSNEHGLRNLYWMLLAPPRWSQEFGQFVPDPHGMSLLLTTPALLWLAATWGRRPVLRGAWAALGLTLVPLIFYYNTGWQQFGYRFSMDFVIPALVLLAVGRGQRLGWPLRVAIALGIAINLYGIVCYYNGWTYRPPASILGD